MGTTRWLAAAVASLIASACGTDPPPAGVMHAGDMLQPGEQLVWNDELLTLQYDGNLVLYDATQSPATAAWETGTAGAGGQRAVMQTDGNFVLYDGGGQVLWASKTSGTDLTLHLATQRFLIEDASGVVWRSVVGDLQGAKDGGGGKPYSCDLVSRPCGTCQYCETIDQICLASAACVQ